MHSKNLSLTSPLPGGGERDRVRGATDTDTHTDTFISSGKELGTLIKCILTTKVRSKII